MNQLTTSINTKQPYIFQSRTSTPNQSSHLEVLHSLQRIPLHTAWYELYSFRRILIISVSVSQQSDKSLYVSRSVLSTKEISSTNLFDNVAKIRRIRTQIQITSTSACSDRFKIVFKITSRGRRESTSYTCSVCTRLRKPIKKKRKSMQFS